MKMKTVTIGYKRDDGDLHVLATLNNNEEMLSTLQFMDLINHVMNVFSAQTGEYIEVFEREDVPDYIQIDE